MVLKAIPRKGMLPIHLPRLQGREWVDPMAAAMTPLLAPYWQGAYQESRSRLSRGRARADDVINPHLRRQIERQSFNFCRSTNESTSRRLEDALDALKHEFIQGLVEQGETGPELARRVKAIFEGLTERHAATIAATEASRAIHAAQESAALESGVVAGKELLISANACELCQMVATEAKQVRLGQAFAVIGNHPEYSTIMHPPLHPNCRCSMIDILLPEYGGPADVEWGLTLFQPQHEIEGGYEPPRGMKVPEPEPERIKEKPAVVLPPKPRPALIDRAVEIATGKGIKVNTEGYARIERDVGKQHAERTHAAYEAKTDTIHINQNSPYWTESRLMIREWSAVKWFSSTDPDHIIRHEIGHALHFKNIGMDPYKKLRTGKFNKEQTDKISKDVSRYAAKNPLELVAEMYAGMLSGKTYDESLMRFYTEKLKGPLP